MIDLESDPDIVRPLMKKAIADAGPEALDDILDALASLGKRAVPRLIEALEHEEVRGKAAAIIVCHNHPSSDPTPSPEDVKVTELIRQAGSILDIELLDHIVIGRQRFVSLKERGLGF